MSLQLNDLYYAGHNHVHLAAGDKSYELPSFLNVSDLVGKALKTIFGTRKPDVDPHLMEIAFSTIEEAVNVGTGRIEYGQPNYDLAQQLRESGALFSAGKSWAQAKELAALTVRPDGKIRSWEEFQTLAQPVIQNYNQTWLKTEYNTGIRSGRAAIQWKKLEAGIGLYPNIEYMPSKAATPREEHKPFYHVIKPVQDDFWVRHLPPSDYACQCWFQQSDDDVTGDIPDAPEPAPGLDNNPGLTGKLFSDNHPYIANLTPEELKYVTKKAKKYVTRRNEDGSRPS